MEGFGKALKETIHIGRLFHAASMEGAAFFASTGDGPECFSTETSTLLVARRIVLVFSAAARLGDYCPVDADAGKNFGWDEFRPAECPARDDVEMIVVPDDLYAAWLAVEEDGDEELDLLTEIAEELPGEVTPASRTPEGPVFYRMD